MTDEITNSAAAAAVHGGLMSEIGPQRTPWIILVSTVRAKTARRHGCDLWPSRAIELFTFIQAVGAFLTHTS